MNIIKKILIPFVAVCVAASLILTAIMFVNMISVTKNMNSLENTINSLAGNTEDVPQEDDVTIGGEYVIKSTLAISDAYKNNDTSKLNDKEKETLDMASKILEEIVTNDMTDYEKELAVYNWMTTNLSFDSGSILVIPSTQADCDNPYGVLKYHNAVCVGYATTFRLFMQMMNIECMVVHDTYLSHSWDLIKLDGHWYHTDIYSDQNGGGYANFNMNDELCQANHSWNQDFFPKADSLNYNYAFQNISHVGTIYEIPEIIKTMLENGTSGALAIEFSNKIEESDAIAVSYMIEQLYNIADSYYQADISNSWIEYNDNYALLLNIIVYNYEPEPSYPDDDIMAAIDEAINNAFPDMTIIDDDIDYDFDDDYEVWDSNYSMGD